MRRRLFAVASAISLLLCLGTVGVWVRSHWRFDYLDYGLGDEPHLLMCSHGDLAWVGYHGNTWGDDPFDRDVKRLFGIRYCYRVEKRTVVMHDQISALPIDWQALGFERTWNSFLVPLWSIVLIAAVLPFCWLLGIGRRILRGSGYCPTCSYDLIGNTSGVCPECGTPVPKEIADGSPRPA